MVNLFFINRYFFIHMPFSQFTTLTVEKTLKQLKTTTKGLSSNEANDRIKQYGHNKISHEEISWWHILLRQFKSSFVYLLLVAVLIALFLGEMLDAGMILLFVGINTLLGFYQEYKSEQTAKLLKRFIKSSVQVMRNGKKIVIESQELVPGDLVIVEAGDIIPADMRFIETNNLIVDESVLSGESVPITKISNELNQEVEEVYQAENIGFSGTHVVSGFGQGVVISTGKNMIIGEIGEFAGKAKRESSFEKGVNKISKFILQLIVITLIFVFLVNVFLKRDHLPISELLIFSIALAVSVIPEALPVVTTFSLSRGALRLAKNKVVVKRLSSVEDLGSIEVLCTDKTGTLTENKLKITEIKAADPGITIFYAGLASTMMTEKVKMANNAFDLAIYQKLSAQDRKNLAKYKILGECPFDPERRRNSVLVNNGKKNFLIVRGAAETIMKLSSNLTAKDKKEINQWLVEQGTKGNRIIALGTKELTNTKNYGAKEEDGLQFIGLIAFFDPIKATANEAVIRAKKLGLQIKILTGDSREVSGAVAYKIGLIERPEDVIDGEEFDKLSPKDQKSAVFNYFVFARISPIQKYKIIQLLQEKYEVGFLGEGINDAPPLKIANVGLVVQGASDIARESADIILLNKNLEIIINGIKEGRSVFANTIKYIKSTIASNFGNFYAIAVSTFFIDYLPMLPLQILLVNLLSDFPMIAVATDTVDDDELKKPKSYNIKEITLLATIFGIVSSIFDFMTFVIFSRFGPQVLQTCWFIESILTELVFIINIRTKFFAFKGKRPSRTLIGLIIVAALATMIIPFTAFGHNVFQFASIKLSYLILILLIVIIYFSLNELVKRYYYRIFNHDEK